METVTNNKIMSIIKQNDSIYASIIAKGATFERFDYSSIVDAEEKLKRLSEENNALKEMAKLLKPPAAPKEEKKPQVVVEKKPKETTEADNDDEENFSDPVLKFSTITNMETIKRTFFAKEYDEFQKLVKEHPFKYYMATYRYSSDKDGAPEYSAKNLLGGFVRGLDDYKKYLFVKFSCVCINHECKHYSYPSMWIVNSEDSIESIIGSSYQDYDFIEVTEHMDSFLTNFRRCDIEQTENLVDEKYVH